ncbi:MAG TPA: sialidase family protein [Gemmataceae bacterium]|nr:sialidase family protein [Gemmataceae bacterium]
MAKAYAIALLCAAAAMAQRGVPPAVTVSAESPFPPSCVQGQTGRNFRNGVVEPWVAADPRDPFHLIGVWQQDRWSNGGAAGLLAAVSFDGGETWTRSAPPFSACASPDVPFARASDPWVSISPDGTAQFISLSLSPGNRHALLVSRSPDGGRRWEPPVTVVEESSPDVLNDKESLTADPLDSSYVYAVWDRVSGMTSPRANDFRGPAWFARTIDGGRTWEPARSIFDPGPNAQTIANQIVVLPDGMLINGFVWITNATAPLVRDQRARIAILRSTDHGATWSEPIPVADIRPVGVSSVKTGVPVRSGALVPALAVDPSSGAIYMTWQDGIFSGGQREGIGFVSSNDGGLTWSTPIRINKVPEVQAFNPAIAVQRNGTIAVTYFDFRKDTDDRAKLMTTLWRVTSTDGGRSWPEAAIGAPFDLAAAPITDGGGYFVGDYHGLAAARNGFVSFFATPSGIVAATRPSALDRTSNGRTEINRYALRRRIQLRNLRQ